MVCPWYVVPRALLAFETVITDSRPARPLHSALTAIDGAHVREESLMLTGFFSRDERNTPKSEVSLRVPLRLAQGRNVIIATATDSAGNTQQATRVISTTHAGQPCRRQSSRRGPHVRAGPW